MTTQIKAGVIAANAVNSSELASGALSGQNFTGDVIFSGTTQGTRLGLGVAPHTTAGLNITTTNQHMRLNNGSELGIIHVLSTGELELWGHGDGESINFRTGSGSGTVAMNIVGNNVGIGTTSPSAKLEVNGGSDMGIRIVSDAGGYSNLQFGDSSDSVRGGITYYSTDDSLQLRGYNNTERMRIDGSGNVGIGVTPTDYYSGGDNLVVGTGTGEGGITLASTGTDQWNYLLFADGTSGDAQYRGQIAYNHSADNLAVTSSDFVTILTGSGRSEKMRIDSSGNVGIGTSSPSADLTLISRAYNSSEAGNSSGIRFTDEGSGSADAILQSIRVGDDGAHLLMGSNCYTATNGGIVQFDSTENSTYVDCNTYNGAIIFGTSTAGSNPDERMRIDSTGNVGIGRTPISYANSQNTLVIEDSHSPAIAWSDTGQARDWFAVAQGSGLHFIYADDGGTGGAANVTTSLVLDNSGNVGIGMDSPIGVLTVDYGTISAGGGVSFRRSSTQRWDFYANSGGNALYSEGNDGYFGTSSSHNQIFVTNETERMRIDSSGRLLVGTTSASVGILGTVNGLGVSADGGPANPVVAFADSDSTVNANSVIMEVSFQNDTSFSAYYTKFTDRDATEGSISGSGAGSVSFNTTSDERLKENIVTTSNKLEKIKQIQVRDFNYIGKDVTTTGLIAQELNTIIPDVVREGSEDAAKDPWAVDYGKLTPYLIKAIQEQQTIIDDLKSRLDEAGL